MEIGWVGVGLGLVGWLGGCLNGWWVKVGWLGLGLAGWFGLIRFRLLEVGWVVGPWRERLLRLWFRIDYR